MPTISPVPSVPLLLEETPELGELLGSEVVDGSRALDGDDGGVSVGAAVTIIDPDDVVDEGGV